MSGRLEVRMLKGRHSKLAGFVDEIGPDSWFARFDEINTFAEFEQPLPPHAELGSPFTVHTTKRGEMYFYWIIKPTWTRRDVKKARQSAREYMTLFSDTEREVK